MITRRAALLSLGALALPDVLRLRRRHRQAQRRTSVILLFVHGGPSHLETYDLKPDAPAEIRGPFRPIRTNVPGIDVCEHLPQHARIAHRFTLIRSCCHDEADHFAGHRRFLSGYGKLKAGTGYESHYPQVGAVVNRLPRRPRRRAAAGAGGQRRRASTAPTTPPASPRATGAASTACRSSTAACATPACASTAPRLDDRLGLLQRVRRAAPRPRRQRRDGRRWTRSSRRALDVLTTGKAAAGVRPVARRPARRATATATATWPRGAAGPAAGRGGRELRHGARPRRRAGHEGLTTGTTTPSTGTC